MTPLQGLLLDFATPLLFEHISIKAVRETTIFRLGHRCGRRNGASLAQLTSDKLRDDAHRFYLRLGYVASHVGFKKSLAADPS